MLTAKDIYVGVVIRYLSGVEYKITCIHGITNRWAAADIQSVKGGDCITNANVIFCNWSVVNNNRITVDSLDYINSPELDDQDKEIIKECLNAQV